MNLLETHVTNITKVETGLPYNRVRITADFEDDDGGKEIQVTSKKFMMATLQRCWN